MLTEKDKLRDNVAARRKELQAHLARLGANTRTAAADEKDRIEAKLRELDTALRDGWEHLTESTAAQLNRWLKN